MNEGPVPTPTWVPVAEAAEASELAAFTRWCIGRGLAPPGVEKDYHALWQWSVTDLAQFWAAVWDYFGIGPRPEGGAVLAEERMPGAVWFPGTVLNYVEYLFRDRDGDAIALVDLKETSGSAAVARELTWAGLRTEVRALAATLRRLGVHPGDRVVAYVPNIAEAVVGFLATASLGAVWASCGQDYSAEAAADRVGQLDPVVLIVADGYRFAGREHDRTAAAQKLRSLLPTVRTTVWVPRLRVGAVPNDVLTWDVAVASKDLVDASPVPFDHPLWVVFSSGTTGKPKGIVHGHGGVLLEHVKAMRLHNDLRASDRFMWFTTPSWMIWNYLVSALLSGAAIVTYDGSPTHPGPDGLWHLADEHDVTFLGTSPGYLAASEVAGISPGRDLGLPRLRMLGSSGAHLPASSVAWVSTHVRSDVQVLSTSGGTDVVTSFAGGAPNLPVWPGELSAPALGVALEAWDPSGRPLVGEVGELVVTRPMPSMPLYFWRDPLGARYRESYFSMWPGVWRHGDWITVTSRGTVIVHGRSDSTLNRNGVRMGSADIYQAVERVPGVAEALVIGAEQEDGRYWMPLFVKLTPGHQLDGGMRDRIVAAIREHASPRHVPDDIIQIEGVPHTRTGKKLEVPAKRLLQGASLSQVVEPGSVDDPGLLSVFPEYRASRLKREASEP